jgi:Ca2+-binding RTX toxin-like protein
VLDGAGGGDTLRGNGGNDVLSGGAGGDTLDGGAGNDALDGAYGNDSLVGGIGDDQLDDTFGNNTLLGGEGNDTLFSLASSVFDGGPGDDLLGTSGVFGTLTGGAGNDTLMAGGFSTINLGTGSDLLILPTWTFQRFDSGTVVVNDFAAGATGDRIEVAQAVTTGLMLDAVHADLTPDRKVALVLAELENGPMMMVGDHDSTLAPVARIHGRVPHTPFLIV